MGQEIADSGVIGTKRKEQKEEYNGHIVFNRRIFSGIRMFPDRDRFGEFTGRKGVVKVFRD